MPSKQFQYVLVARDGEYVYQLPRCSDEEAPSHSSTKDIGLAKKFSSRQAAIDWIHSIENSWGAASVMQIITEVTVTITIPPGQKLQLITKYCD